MKRNKIIVALLFAVLFIWMSIITVREKVNNEISSDSVNVSEYNVAGFSTDLSKVVDEEISSMVAINQNTTVSSGFVYACENGNVYVATTLHGVANTNTADVYLHSGAKLKGTVIKTDPILDLALIECPCDFEVKPLQLGDSELINDGEFIVGIGTRGSLEYDFSSQFGMISSKYREVLCDIDYNDNNYRYYLPFVQLSGEFDEGYSGTPLLNMNGQAVAIINQEDDGVVLATTINEVKLVLNKMLNDEEYQRFNIGVSGKYISKLNNYETVSLGIGLEVVNGYYVDSVLIDSFASNIGIVKGDIITEINGVSINDYNSLLNVIYSSSDEYTITVIRNDSTIEFTGLIND